MSTIKSFAVLAAISTLSACGGGGGGGGSSDDDGGGGGPAANPGLSAFNASQTVATSANGGVLADAERDDQGNSDPTDDTVTATGGFAVASDGTIDTAVTSTTTGANPTEFTLNGTTYSVAQTSAVSAAGDFARLSGGDISGDSSSVSILATGTDLDGAGTPDDVYGYVRGLATLASDVTVTGSVTYNGDAKYAVVGSDDVTSGTFDLTTDFAATEVTGAVDLGGLTGTIDADRSNGEVQGTVAMSGAATGTLDLNGNFYGLNAEEFAGSAFGDVGTDSGVLVLQGSR